MGRGGERFDFRRMAGSLALASIAWIGGCEVSDPYPGYGFHAEYDTPKVRPDDWCGTNNGGWRNCEWTSGPHADFARREPARLAQESLRWFEGSWTADRWRGNATARLELIYPSDECNVTVRYHSDGAAGWEAQLRSWFERFPPRGEGRPSKNEGEHDWTIEFGEQGSVRGIAASDLDAVHAMKKMLAGAQPGGAEVEPNCKLGVGIRRSSHEMDCFSVEGAAGRVEDLPRKLREKRENPYGRG